MIIKAGKQFIKNMLLLIASILLALFVAEAATKSFFAQEMPLPFVVRHIDRDVKFHGYQPDPNLFWKIKPDTHYRLELIGRPVTEGQSNQYGLRGPDFPLAKADGERRILFLGDSATFGLFVQDEESYPFKTVSILNQTGNSPWRAINGAATGYTSQQVMIYLEQFGLEFFPDIVCICIGHNDCSLRLINDRQSLALTTKKEGGIALVRLWNLAVLKLKMVVRPFCRFQLTPRVLPNQYRENLERISDSAEKIGARIIFIAGPGRYPPMTNDYFSHEFVTNPIALEIAKERGAIFMPLDGLRASGPSHNRDLFYDSYHPNERGHMEIATRLASAIMQDALAGKTQSSRPPLDNDQTDFLIEN